MNRLQDLPGPRGLPVIGISLDLRKDPLGFFARTAREHGPIVPLKLRKKTLYQLNDPELVHELLSRPDDFDKVWSKSERSTGPSHRDVFGAGLVTNTGEAWKRQRQIIQPSFRKHRFGSYLETIPEQVDSLLTELRGPQPSLYGFFERLSLGITARNLFGEVVGAEVHRNIDLIGRCFATFNQTYDKRLVSPVKLPASVPLPSTRRFYEALERLDDLVYGLIDRHERVGEGAGRAARGTDEPTFFSLLLDHRDADGAPMPRRQIRDEIMTMMLAGYETVAHALTWTLVLMSRHPESFAQIEAEAAEILGDDAPSLDALHRLERTRAVMLESMRVLPPIWCLNMRIALRDTELGGHAVPRRTPFFVCLWSLHRDPRRFADPERFHPARWLEPGFEESVRSSYLPFGGGGRTCIGNELGMRTILMVLASLARRGRLWVPDAGAVVPRASFTLRPTRPVPFRWVATEASRREVA